MRGLVFVVLAPLLVGCATGAAPGSAGPGTTGGPSASESPAPAGTAAATIAPAASGDIGAELCQRVAEVEANLVIMRAVELRLPNRVALDIELGQLQVAMQELQDAELGSLEEDLELPLRRLGYRLDEVALAVEDFRTNPRPQRAVPHVEEDSQALADELAAFILLARC